MYNRPIPEKWQMTPVIIISILLIVPSSIILRATVGSPVSDCPPTRSGEDENDNITVPDFDVQFMIDPSIDPLDPLFGEKWVVIESGMIAVYWVLISNLGPVNDTYHIELDEPPADTGWGWYFKNTGLLTADVELTSPSIRDAIGGKSFTTMIVRIVSPIDPRHLTQIPIGITAKSTGLNENHDMNDIFDRDEMIIVSGCSRTFAPYETHETLYFVNPGEWVNLSYFLYNPTSIFLNFTVNVDVNDFWRTNFRYWEDLYIPMESRLEFSWNEKNISVPSDVNFQLNLSFRLSDDWKIVTKIPFTDHYLYDEGEVFQFRLIFRLDPYPISPSFRDFFSEVITVIVRTNSSTSTEIDDQENENNTEPLPENNTEPLPENNTEPLPESNT